MRVMYACMTYILRRKLNYLNLNCQNNKNVWIYVSRHPYFWLNLIENGNIQKLSKE